MNKSFLILIILLATSQAHAESFQEIIKLLDRHQLVQQKKAESLSLRELAKSQGSWGDPVFRISAINYPISDLKSDRSPMTGIQYNLSQNIPLSGKFKNRRESQLKLSQARKLDSQRTIRELKRGLWIILIQKEKLVNDLKIYQDDLDWANQTLVVSKKLYSNGKIGSQDLLDVQIRKSKAENLLSVVQHKLKELNAKLSYIVPYDKKNDLNITKIPWPILESYRQAEDGHDYGEQVLKKQIEASDLKHRAEKQGIIPDINFGISYTTRSNIDGNGNFVGASISFPLPFTSSKYGKYKSAVFQRMEAKRSYKNYINKKVSRLKELKQRISSTQSQLKILKDKILVFAQSSRDITFKAYIHGKVSYLNLLSAETQLQEVLLQRNSLQAELKIQKLEYLFILGAKLN